MNMQPHRSALQECGFRSPLVSVVIPTHNRPAMLAEALESVLAQTFSDYEVIVVSNGESLNQAKASRQAAARAGVRYHSMPQGNVSAARNYGVKVALGEYIAFLDDDDLWMPNKLKCQVETLNKTGADAVIADFEVWYANGSRQIGMTRPPTNRSIRDGFLLANYGGGAASGILVKKQKLIDAGLFDPTLRAAEDWDMWARLAEVATITYISEVLSCYRIHTVNITHKHLFVAWGEFNVYCKNLRRAPSHMKARILVAMLIRPVLVPVYLKLNENFRYFLRWLYKGRSSLGLKSHYWQFRAWLRPRSRYWAFRAWLRPRTRLKAAVDLWRF